MPPPITEQTKRFVKAVKSLIDSGKAGTEKEIAERLEYNYSALNQIMNGHRNVPSHVYQKFTEIYMPVEIIRNDPDKTAVYGQAIGRVILRAIAEMLAKQRGESVTKTLGDLEAAVRAETLNAGK